MWVFLLLSHHLQYPSAPMKVTHLSLSFSLLFAIFLFLEYSGSPITMAFTDFVRFSSYKHGCSPLSVFRQMTFHTYASSLGRLSHAPHFTSISVALTSKCTRPAGTLSPAPLADSFLPARSSLKKALSFFHSEWIQYDVARLPTFAGSPSCLLVFFPSLPHHSSLEVQRQCPFHKEPFPEPVIAPTPSAPTSP